MTHHHAAIHLRWDVTDSLRLRSDGGNLAAVLLGIQGTEPMRYQLIVRQIQRCCQRSKTLYWSLSRAKCCVALGGFAQRQGVWLSPHIRWFPARLFCLLTLLNLPVDRLPDVMFLMNLNWVCTRMPSPWWPRCSSGWLQAAGFIATQSPYMVDCLGWSNIIVADNHGGETTLRNLPADAYQQWLDDDYLLSDIWLKSPAGVSDDAAVCVCEGPTEANFVQQCLAQHLAVHGVYAYASIIKAPSGRHKGGRVTVERLVRHLSHEYRAFDRLTTLVIFYGFQDRDGRSRAEIEQAILSGVQRCTTGLDTRFVLPYANARI